MPKQPPRTPSDGPIAAHWNDAEHIQITVTTDGVTESITMTGFNACRILASLSLLLDMPLSTSAAKAIKIT